MSDDTFLSFVLLDELRPIDPIALLSVANAKLSAIGAHAAIESAVTDAGPIVVNIAGQRFTILIVDRPVPTRDLQESIDFERRWRDVDAGVARHSAHIIVAPMSKLSSHSSVVSSAIFITLLTASIVELASALDVWWSTGAKLTEAAAFVRQASGIAAKRIPVLAWVQLTSLAGPQEGGDVIVTTGLRPFVGRELEWQPSQMPPDEAAKRVLGVASYLIANGLAIKDGETIGLSEQERIGVKYADHGHRPGVPVLRLALDSEGSAARAPHPRKAS